MSTTKLQLWIGAAGAALTIIHSAPVLAADLARVNNRPITDKDLRTATQGMTEGQRASALKDPTTRRQMVLSLVDQELLVQQGEREKLDQAAEYREALALFRKQYLATKVMEKNLGAQLNDKMARKYYEAHKREYSTDQVQVMHILVADEAQARDVMRKVAGQGADFQALAEKISRDPSARNNRGDLGFITQDAPLVKEFKEAAFSGTPGQIVGPVKTAFGFHVLKIGQKKTGRPMNYDEVELRVKNDLRQELVELYVGKLRKAAKITVDDKAIDKL